MWRGYGEDNFSALRSHFDHFIPRVFEHDCACLRTPYIHNISINHGLAVDGQRQMPNPITRRRRNRIDDVSSVEGYLWVCFVRQPFRRVEKIRPHTDTEAPEDGGQRNCPNCPTELSSPLLGAGNQPIETDCINIFVK